MATLVIDRKTRELLGDVATPWLIQKGGGRAYSEEGFAHIWMAADYPGTVIPDGARQRDVQVIERPEDPFDAECICVIEFDEATGDDVYADHPYLEAQCSAPACSDEPGTLRRCSMSDCVCHAFTTDTCAHCGAPATVHI